MWEYLQHLAVQQSTAPELATFLVVVTAACILLAGTIYMGIMTAAWMLRLRVHHSWREVVFPDLELRQRFSWEYALAALTSVVLVLTLAEKDGLVDEVLTLPASEFIDQHLVASAFPLHRLPSGSDLGGGTSFREEVQQLPGLTLGGLARGPLQAGRSGEFRPVFIAAVREVLAQQPTWRAKLPRYLKGLCVGLILVYLGWLSRGRIRELGAAKSNVKSPYAEVMTRLSMLGVCLALLLATPLLSNDSELLADSALAAARRAPDTPETHRLDSLVRAGTERQSELLATGLTPDTYSRRFLELTARMDRLSERFYADTGSAPGMRLALDSLAARLAALSDPAARLLAHERDIQALEREYAGLEKLSGVVSVLQERLDSLGNRGLLLVQTDAGQEILIGVAGRATARRAGRGASFRIIARDTTAGLHWLSPGTYEVRTRTAGSKTVTIEAGQAAAATLTGQMIR